MAPPAAGRGLWFSQLRARRQSHQPRGSDPLRWRAALRRCESPNDGIASELKPSPTKWQGRETDHMRIAITRQVSLNIGACELTHLARLAIDVDLARSQHRAYEKRLAALGCEIVSLPAESSLPDSVFVEDTAVVFDDLAIISRPGADSRKPETRSVAEALRPYRDLSFIEAPGTIDGGDVLQVGKRVYVGASSRSNQAGIEQMRAILTPVGYTVQSVQVNGCLHLKSAITQVAAHALLVNRDLVEPGPFGCMELIDVDPAEPHGANAVLMDETVVYSAAYPRTRDRLEARGISVQSVDVSELAKAEGAVTCCSLIFTYDQGAR